MAVKVNGSPLDSLDGIEGAFGYLGKAYNDGAINRNLDGSRVIITSRSSRFQHLDSLLDAHAAGDIRIGDMYATTDGRQKIEVAEA